MKNLILYKKNFIYNIKIKIIYNIFIKKDSK